ncbi:P-loop containing nucleoside triphosphate hydrolase protein [Mucor mucedo]|uniref:P-loop containing nucleoside triphosphate hydrolase protein n=1 Tax=Mucor mucedo TaxID=29922 RepID=UPI00221E42C0|nr:P-loop containing nucleoside triphosphate hydrolase protein [Mucor mucedo]KAI7892138.1 P-loop containing nucleoside triphosphate hydrolase protein [Mucor mucedo]
MFRCVSSNVRLTPLYKRQCTTLFSKPLLPKPGFRQAFSSSQHSFQQEAKDQVTAAAAATAKKADRSDVKRLFQLAKPEMKSITAATGLLVVSSAITMSVPFSMGKIIDIVTHPTVDSYLGLTLPEFAGALSMVFVLGAAANAGRVLLFRIAGERIIQRLRNNLYQSILKQDMAFFDKNRTGELISRLSTDTAIVGKSLTNNVSDGLRALATASVGSSMMFIISPKLTGIMMLVVPPVAFFGIVYGRYVKSLSRKTQNALSEITKVAEERISSVRTVQAFAKEKSEEKRYGLRVEEVFSLAKKEALASGAFFGGAGLSGNLAVLAVLLSGGKMVMENIITIGELTSFMLYTAYVGTSLGGLTSFYSEIMKGVGASDRLFELLERKSPISVETGKALKSIDGKIQFEGINFSYPTRPQSQIFKDFSLTVNPGTVIAIVGPSGSGKSTIGSLLLRYYDPLSGNILIDGNNIKDINLHWWREQVGVVSQEPVLFAGTIAENISYGRENATFEEIQEAATKANCASFINTFADKYETLVGERGVSLSGGQKQRIAIARALLKDPKILILDEATSALDSESEVLVQDALNHLMKGRTVFTIAHRLSTIRSADLVACLNDGGVAELGTYHELLSREDGVFRHLVELQSLGDQEDKAEK